MTKCKLWTIALRHEILMKMSQKSKKVFCQILLLKHFLFSLPNKIASKAENRLTNSRS